jgi:adenylate kinase
LELDEEESVSRLLERGKTSGRSDDNELVIRNRLKEYYDKTLPVLQFYKDKGIYVAIDSKDSIEQVHAEVDKVIQEELSKNLLNIVLFGIPGSGRGRQGIALAKRYGLEYISIGTMLEDEIKKKTKIGIKIKEQRESGLLAPDEIIVQLIEQKLANSQGSKGFIFKGFPRTLVQSYILDGLLQQHGSGITEIIEIEVPTLEAMARLHARSKNKYAKAYDKSTGKIINRMHEHEKKTLPVIEKYKALHNVKKVDGVGSIIEVFERLSNEIEIGFRKL